MLMIRAFSIHLPSIVRTKIRDAIDKKTAASKGKSIPEQQADWLIEIAIRRKAAPADAAEVVAWFVSLAAWYVTGQSLQVDGRMRFH
ncbi:SDR family oxidoreductase [Secundilactobacillus kimchicus]|uniref:SDR family oxidoreductase n=1 Tax=Secundilactobacillus kimchicus TaxID=528209 RepID=UPI0024A965D4|nr:SDR family oxidoreductase [Secundilactobacillus kimchicus]